MAMILRYLFNQTSLPVNTATVSETRINSHNERPEGVEAALWISSVPGDMVLGLV